MKTSSSRKMPGGRGAATGRRPTQKKNDSRGKGMSRGRQSLLPLLKSQKVQTSCWPGNPSRSPGGGGRTSRTHPNVLSATHRPLSPPPHGSWVLFGSRNAIVAIYIIYIYDVYIYVCVWYICMFIINALKLPEQKQGRLPGGGSI